MIIEFKQERKGLWNRILIAVGANKNLDVRIEIKKSGVKVWSADNQFHDYWTMYLDENNAPPPPRWVSYIEWDRPYKFE
jgi:hypothetical protein